MHKIYSLLLVFFITSCSTKISYIGQAHIPTKKIDVFVTEQSIKRPFDFVGKGYLRGYTFLLNPEKLMEKARKKGLEKGADAVLITDYYIPDTGGTSINSFLKTDSIGKSAVTIGSATIRPLSSSGYNILYIKYAD